MVLILSCRSAALHFRWGVIPLLSQSSYLSMNKYELIRQDNNIRQPPVLIVSCLYYPLPPFWKWSGRELWREDRLPIKETLSRMIMMPLAKHIFGSIFRLWYYFQLCTPDKSENLRLLVVYVMKWIGLVLHLKLFGLHKSHVVMITSTSYWKNKTKNVFPQTQVLRGNFRKMILFKKRIPAAYEKPTSKFYRMRKIST